MTKNQAIIFIADYVGETLFKTPRLGLPKGMFETRSRERWAVEEILTRIADSDFSPISVVQDFLDQMELYSHKGKKTDDIFEVARDVASDILEGFLIVEGDFER